MNNLAIFIDGDGISGHHYQNILSDLKQEGRVLVQRVYADFTKPTSATWQDTIIANGMEAIQVFRVAKKESTDNSLIVDCMDHLYNVSTIQKYVIVSSDSDFSSLATKIRLKGLFCIGIGYHHTPLKLRNNCDKFIVIESVINRSSQSLQQKVVSPINDASKGIDHMVKTIFEERTIKMILVEEFMVQCNKQVSIQELQGVPYLKLYNGRLYYFIQNGMNLLERIIHFISLSERDMIHMSYLKDFLLNIDSSFEQQRYGFLKMADFAEMIIDKSTAVMGKDEKNNSVIINK
jgi:hypothetical protein